jgi:hypothetical protein
MVPPSEHPRIEALDRLAARTHKQEGQQGVQHAGETGQDHPASEIRGVHQVLTVRFAYGLGMLGEQFVHIHITNSTMPAQLPGCEQLMR